jgi:aldehyde:ferredoxin oxidoreductase
MESILRIDMGAAGGPTASLDPLGRYAGLAGRAMTSIVVAEEVDPACHALGEGNKLVLAPGRPSGRSPADAGLVSVGCKSPLTGGVVASSAEAPGAEALRGLGYAAVVLEGQPAGADLWTVVIDASGVAFAVENRYRTLGNLETVAKLRRAYGPHAALLTIGQAGEMGLGAASLSCPAGGARPTRHCGRGGAGAVMGSKRLKAIVVDGGPDGGARLERGPGSPEPASPYREACDIRDPVVLRQLEALEDDLGLDSAEVAAAVSLAMEAGLARFGDGQAALRLVEEIARGTPLGRIVGSGVKVMAEAFGLEPRVARWSADAAAWRPGGARSLVVAEAELGAVAREVVAAERRFLARASAATEDERGSDGEPGVRIHPIVFGEVDDDVARLFGALDPDADPFDPQLQLPIGLRSPHPVGSVRLPPAASLADPRSQKS